MSIPRRRRRSIRTVIADLQSAIADLDARVDALEEEDEWFLEEPTPTLPSGAELPIPTLSLIEVFIG